MIEVIYREDVSEETIHEPRNVTQIGSVDPKYRIYMEDAVLTYIRKMTCLENEVYYGLLLGELKRAAGTTYLFIRGMVKASEKGTEAEAGRGSAGDHRAGSGAVALERLTKDRHRMKEAERQETEAWPDPGIRNVEPNMETPGPAEFDTQKNQACPAIEFDGDTWTRLYEDINRYFPDLEILGWYASFPFINVAGFDLCRQTHYTHFSGADKVLFLCDRTEREENFYRPDGLELRETEGYFTFFEKNDAMQVYCREKEPAKKAGDAAESGEGRRSEIRQGTVGEAPRKKWNISAASVLVTAALLAAVLIVNQYNGKLKSRSADNADGSVKEEASSVQALAADGQVMEPGADGDTDENGAVTGDRADNGDTTGDGATTGTGADDEDKSGDGADDGDTDGNGATTGTGADDEDKSGDGTYDGDTDGNGATTGTGADDEDKSGDRADDGDTDGDGTVSGDGAGSGNIAENGSTAAEDETVQTGSRVSARYYTVQTGETLYSICMDVYKTSAMVEIVRELNGIGEDYAIQAGQKILLP